MPAGSHRGTVPAPCSLRRYSISFRPWALTWGVQHSLHGPREYNTPHRNRRPATVVPCPALFRHLQGTTEGRCWRFDPRGGTAPPPGSEPLTGLLQGSGVQQPSHSQGSQGHSTLRGINSHTASLLSLGRPPQGSPEVVHSIPPDTLIVHSDSVLLRVGWHRRIPQRDIASALILEEV